MKPAFDTPSTPEIAALQQVGALPIRFVDGAPQVLLLTSRESRRWVIPKGWPMKGKKNWAAAAQEAKEEGGIVGKTHKEPIGSFRYFKRRAGHFDLCSVEVYALSFEKTLENYREKGQRDQRWFALDEAPDAVQEPGLMALLKTLDLTPFRKPTKKAIAPERKKKVRKGDKKARKKG